MKRKFFKLLPFMITLLPILGHAASTGSTVVLSEQDKQNVLKVHNKVRCDLTVSAAAMPNLTWNNLLYQVAQNYANKCVFQHNSNRSADYAALGGKGYVGENIYVIKGVKAGVYLTQAMNSFASEKVNFSYMDPVACKKSGSICGCVGSGMCGHYTQMIWDHTTSVACAQADCTNTPLGGQFVVCDYAPGGNYISTEPYISSKVPVNTAACQAAYSSKLSAELRLSASSDKDHLPNMLDGNLNTFWSPHETDSSPSIVLELDQPLDVDKITLRWKDAKHAAKSVQIEYLTEATGEEWKVLSTQVLPESNDAVLALDLQQIRRVKLQFLDAHDLNIQIAALDLLEKSKKID